MLSYQNSENGMTMSFNKSCLTASGELNSATFDVSHSTSTTLQAKAGDDAGRLRWKKANELALKAACELQMSNGDSVAGSLYEAQSGEQTGICSSPLTNGCSSTQLMSYATRNFFLKTFCRRRVPKCVCLSRDRAHRVWNTRSRREHEGNTVVELSAEAAKDCEESGATFLKIGEAHTGDEVRLK